MQLLQQVVGLESLHGCAVDLPDQSPSWAHYAPSDATLLLPGPTAIVTACAQTAAQLPLVDCGAAERWRQTVAAVTTAEQGQTQAHAQQQKSTGQHSW